MAAIFEFSLFKFLMFFPLFETRIWPIVKKLIIFCSCLNYCVYSQENGGKKFLINCFRYGEILDYEDEGIVHAGDFNNGECGIIVRDIDYEKSGTWKCEVLRKQRPGSSVIGSEITATTFKVDVFRTSRLNDDDFEFQVICIQVKINSMNFLFFLSGIPRRRR